MYVIHVVYAVLKNLIIALNEEIVGHHINSIIKILRYDATANLCIHILYIIKIEFLLHVFTAIIGGWIRRTRLK